MWRPRTVVITDRTRLGDAREGEDALVAFVSAVAAAGADVVQLRERDWADAQLVRVARRLMGVLAATPCRLLVNERTHVAMASGAHGVQVRASGMPCARVRACWPTGGIGRSVHPGESLALTQGADFLLAGMIFPSVSKDPTARAAGVSFVKALAATPAGPAVVAVGGMSVARARVVADAGACGLAGIDLFARAWRDGPAALREVIEEIHTVFEHGEQAR